MKFSNIFTKEVLIRLQGDEAFAATVKFGRFYSKTKEFTAGCEASPQSVPKSASPVVTYVVPPPAKPRGRA